METTPRGALAHTLPAFESHQLSVAALQQVTTKEVEAVLSGSSFTRYQIKAIELHMRLEKIGRGGDSSLGKCHREWIAFDTFIAVQKNALAQHSNFCQMPLRQKKVWPASREQEFCKLIDNLCSRSFFLASAESASPFAWDRKSGGAKTVPGTLFFAYTGHMTCIKSRMTWFGMSYAWKE